MMEENTKIETEEDKEAISIAKRNLRMLKRIALGRNKPPFFLRILCWANLGWSFLMVIYNFFIGIVMNISALKVQNFDSEITRMGGKYFFTYAVLHLIAMFGVLLIWRIKKSGFYIYTISTAIMPFLYLLMARQIKIELTLLLFSALSIGLFALNWKQFAKKEEA